MEKKTAGLLVFVLLSVTLLCVNYFKLFDDERKRDVQRFENITKSPNDKRAYRGLKLSNSLTALLISDPTTDIAAASLAVTAGSINENVPGLAHFLEHMLFMGSEKYSQENDFELFVSTHAGMTNAFTDVDITNFQFKVDAQSLTPTLDRFAQFFIAPLLAPSAIGREVNAVNSEHKMYVSNDDMRLEQLEISMSRPEHPYNHFFTGNLDTLIKEPTSRNVSIRDELFKFHSTWYSSNSMNLVVLGKENLEQLENIVISSFGEIENKNVTPMAYSYENHPWGPKQVKRKIFMVPLADVHRVKLVFPTPSVDDQYKTAPADYLADLIEDEGPRGLLSTLKKRGLCESSTVDYHSYCGFAFFAVEFGLTEEAAKKLNTAIDEIIALTFQYIKLLNTSGIQEGIFEEDRKTNEMAFTYKDKESPLPYAVSISADMHTYPIEDILSNKYSRNLWKPSLIESYLNFLTPHNMNVFVIDPSFESIADQTDPWYGTKYAVEKIPDSLLEAWKTIELSPELLLPRPNDFIAENFDLYPIDKHNPKNPYVIHETSLSRFWFKQDDLFKLPKLGIRFEILSPIVSSSPSHRMLAELFLKMFRDSFDEFAYAARQAKLQWFIDTTENGIYVELFGFNEKLPNLLEALLSNLTHFDVQENRFKILSDMYIRDLKNFEAQDLYGYTRAIFGYLTRERQWTVQELLDAKDVLQVENVREFKSKLFSRISVQGLIHGNCDKQEAIKIVNIIENSFESISTDGGAPQEELSLLRQIKMKDGADLVYETSNKYHPHSSLFAYYDCNTESALNNTLMELFVQIIEEPCFNVLRTVEQLGYLVVCSLLRLSGVQGLVVIIESEKHPMYVNSRVEAFLDSMQGFLSNMTEKDFEAYKTALATKKLEKPKQLDSSSNKYWYEIGNRLYNFERQVKEVKQLRSLKKQDILNFYEKSISKSSSRRRKLAVNVVSKVTNPEKPENLTIESTRIESIKAFRKSVKYSPLPPSYMEDVAPLGIKQK